MRSAFYDFSCSPFSFDVVHFIISARARGCEHIVFVEGDRGWSKFYDKDEERKRFYNILVPLAGSHSLMSREQAKELWSPDCYPEGYKLDKPTHGHTGMHATTSLTLTDIDRVSIKPNPSAVEKMQKMIGPGRPVVITLRQTSTKPERNSNIKAWLRFAAHLSERGTDVVIVPDTESDAVQTKCRVISEAAHDVQLRLALYSLARVNMGVNNGPMALVFYSSMPLLYFKPITQGYQETSDLFWAMIGLRRGDQPEWFNERQRIVWGEDDYETLAKAWEGHVARELHLEPAATAAVSEAVA